MLVVFSFIRHFKSNTQYIKIPVELASNAGFELFISFQLHWTHFKEK